MNYLLDTHILLWWLEDNSNLSKKTYSLIADPENTIFISVASLWEMRIKEGIGKLKIPDMLLKAIEDQGFEKIDIKAEHTERLKSLTYKPNSISLTTSTHNDPFDRMLIAQSINESITIITNDKVFKDYEGVEVVINKHQ